MLEDPNKPPFAGDFFTGVPAPAGAICVPLPIYLELIGLPRLMASPAVAAAYLPTRHRAAHGLAPAGLVRQAARRPASRASR